jgi:dolichyl-phosphate-mannose-protein mannosyltransferase
MARVSRPFPFVAGALLVAFAFTRLYNLSVAPIFCDEAIYAHWALLGFHDSSHLLDSLADGKQPSFIWLVVLTLNVVSDPLLAGRLLSVVMGLSGMIGAGLLGQELFRDKGVGYLSSLLYLVTPMFVTYDRLALYDTMTTSLTLWGLYLSVRMVRRLRVSSSMLLGLVLGLGLLTKSSAVFSFVHVVATWLLLDRRNHQGSKTTSRWMGLVLLSWVVGFLVFFPLLLASCGGRLFAFSTRYVQNFSEWSENPLATVAHHAPTVFRELGEYVTYPVLGLAVIALLFSRTRWRPGLFLFLYFIMPAAVLVLAMREHCLYPRYFMPAAASLIVLTAQGLRIVSVRLRWPVLRYALVLAVVLPMLRFDALLLFHHRSTPFPHTDRAQFVLWYTSGYGFDDAVRYLRRQAEKRPIRVVTQRGIGLIPSGLGIYFANTKRVKIAEIDAIGEHEIRELAMSGSKVPTYLILTDMERQYRAQTWMLEPVAEFLRPERWTSVVVYLVNRNAKKALTYAGKTEPGGTVTFRCAMPLDRGFGYRAATWTGPGAQTRHEALEMFRQQPLAFLTSVGCLPGVLDGYVGTLDENGETEAKIRIPEASAFNDLVLHTVFVTFFDKRYNAVKSISNVVTFTIKTH